MADLTNQLQAAAGASTGVASDADFENTVLLLHGDGTNGAQNNTFVDSSTNNFTITRNGNTTQGTFSPFSKPDGAWGNYFDGSGDYLTLASNAALSVGSSDFTLESWIYSTSFAAAQIIWLKRPTAAARGILLNTDITTGIVRFRAGDSSGPSYTWDVEIASSSGIALNTWTHIAVTRSGSTWTLYVNGTSAATTTSSFTVDDASGTAYIGSVESGGSFVSGYLSNIRLVKGSVVYSGNFTPPTAPLTAITNTSLLTCQSNRFIDNSSNAFAITRNGDVKVTPFSPFPITTAYSPSVNGGAGYFDGTGDTLTSATVSTSIGTGDYCLEAWVYVVASGSFSTFIQLNNSAGYPIFLQTNAGTARFLDFQNPGTNFNISGGTVRTASWNHIVGTRQSGTMRIFVNGVLVANVGSINFNYGTAGTISTGPSTAQYTSDLRVTIGSVPTDYQTSSTTNGTVVFTPPTAPLTTSAKGATSGDVDLLLNFTNAGIFDNTGFNALETVGNAQIDTTTKKYGTGSMEFDGTTDYAVQPTSDNYGYGTGDFTIEFWLRLNSTGNQTIFSHLTSASSTNPHIYINTTIRYYTAGGDRITGASLSTGQWYHIAVCRASGSTRLFIDGTQSGSTYSDTNNYGVTAPLGIGTYWNSGAPVTASTLNGLVDDLRITKGIARYTTTFTPPTAALPDIGA
jgi:hypothetical protein